MSCIKKTLSLIGIVLVLLMGAAADATTIVINATDSGWYDDTGSHTQSNENYLVGWRGAEYRNFFVFDLTAIPVTDTVVSATLRLFNPAISLPAILANGYSSPDLSETYEVVEVTTPVPLLILGGTLLTPIYNDLGDGTVFGTRAVSAADNGANVDIALDAAGVAAIDAGVGLFALGGHVSTLTSGFPNEFVFGSTGATSLRQLVIETNAVPEPGSGALVGVGLAAVAVWRRHFARVTRA
jgi:hypothetical protein